MIEREAPDCALSELAFADLLALADDELVIGHRHSQWLGLSPFLEEDLTMASIAQDEMGHARALYACIWPSWIEREADVVRRPARDWRSCDFVEMASPSWEWSLVRHWIYDTAESFRWDAAAELHGPEVNGLVELVAKVNQEERFHRHHAEQLIVRLGAANADGNARLQSAVDELVPMLAHLNLGSHLGSAYEALVVVADRAGLTLPKLLVLELDEQKKSRRHADFAEIHEALLSVVSIDPGATW